MTGNTGICIPSRSSRMCETLPLIAAEWVVICKLCQFFYGGKIYRWDCKDTVYSLWAAPKGYSYSVFFYVNGGTVVLLDGCMTERFRRATSGGRGKLEAVRGLMLFRPIIAGMCLEYLLF